MIYAAPGSTRTHGFLGPTGLAGTARLRIIADGSTITAATTDGITEYPAGSGVYQAEFTAPDTVGSYLLVIDDGSATPAHIEAADLYVTFTLPSTGASSGDYITEDELKDARELTGLSFADGQIPNVITAASRCVDKLCGTLRRFYLDDDATSVRYYRARDCHTIEIDDLVQLTSLETDYNGDGTYETTWASTDYVLEPFNAPDDDWPYETISITPTGRYRFPTYRGKSVKVTGQFGWAAVPAEVWTATMLLSVRYLLRAREAPAGIIAVGSAIEGSVMRLARTDPDVPGLLERFSRKRVLL